MGRSATSLPKGCVCSLRVKIAHHGGEAMQRPGDTVGNRARARSSAAAWRGCRYAFSWVQYLASTSAARGCLARLTPGCDTAPAGDSIPASIPLSPSALPGVGGLSFGLVRHMLRCDTGRAGARPSRGTFLLFHHNS